VVTADCGTRSDILLRQWLSNRLWQLSLAGGEPVADKISGSGPNALAAGRDFHGNEPVVRECPLGNTETPMAVGSGYTP